MSKPVGDDKVTAPDVEAGDGQSQMADTKLEVPADADIAAGFLLNTDRYGELSPEAEKRLKRKLDWFMIPMVSLDVLKILIHCILKSLVVSRCHSWSG